MEITLDPITAENWHTCIELELESDQERLVASNLYSIAQASVEPACVPLAIYHGAHMIGFLMYEDDPDTGGWWLARFMIDHRCQGSGYGRAALESLVHHLRDGDASMPIRLSIVPENTAARALYRSAGFVETGVHHNGEAVLMLPAGTSIRQRESRG